MLHIFRIVFFSLCLSTSLLVINLNAQNKQDYEGGRPDGCTSITVGKKASQDGSVITSHTCDSHRTRVWLDIQPAEDHSEKAQERLFKRTNDDSLAMPAYKYDYVGSISQIDHTHGYINTAYPCMNDHQLAIGESTFGGREEKHLLPDAGSGGCWIYWLLLWDCIRNRKIIPFQ
jgi:dipeptidase